MARKKAAPVEEENPNLEGLNPPEAETAEETYAFPEDLPKHIGEDPEAPPADTVDPPQDGASNEENEPPPSDQPDIPPEDIETGEFAVEVTENPTEDEMPPETPAESEDFPETLDSAEIPETVEPDSENMPDPPADMAELPTEDIPKEPGGATLEEPIHAPPKNDR